ncbi:NACHT domain-containing protein [Saccharothrix sp.]|uniref:NACHT domain-containing protein n=1 Tax=Saccharothrix sp. TaxID=1873460 RepID=UPI0028123DF0|nr:NACHT domain-containing protein [Saccharothrix sp.]
MLGSPGAGKTTMLLTLLEDLLDNAAHDRTYPIPVVFPLSSWASDRDRRLEEWFVDELCGPLYGLPRDLAEQWVTDERVLPLLDGLDEVALGRRPACARAIDAFHATHRLLPLVVSSRAADYEALDL